MTILTRRKFCGGLASGMVGLHLGRNALAQEPSGQETTAAAPKQSEPKIVQYNPLGKTGIKTSDITFGAGSVFSVGVIRYAFDVGINLFDTAESYMNGMSEEIIGEGLQDVRQKAYIITKQNYQQGQPIKKEDIITRLETSLKKLRSDYVDLLFIHELTPIELLNNEEILAAYSQLKKDGKIRFTGFSTHHEEASLAECIKPEHKEFVDVVLLRYNHLEGKNLEPLIAQVREKGIGTIAMKTLAGGKQGALKSFVNEQVSYPQAAIGWVLANKNIDCAVLSMNSYSHVENFAAASGKKLDRTDLALLQRYQQEVDQSYCRVTCTACEGSCPSKVAISDVMRHAMYFEDYGNQQQALSEYAALAQSKKPQSCIDCNGYCNAACPYGLPVQATLIQTHKLLTG